MLRRLQHLGIVGDAREKQRRTRHHRQTTAHTRRRLQRDHAATPLLEGEQPQARARHRGARADEGALGVAAGLLGGVIGFGTTIILTPALVYHYGALQTVPIIAVVATVANASRIAIWWREIDWRIAGAYSAAAVPAVALGAHTLVHLPERWVGIALGAFLLALIPIRRWLRNQPWRMRGWHMECSWRDCCFRLHELQ